MRLQVYSLKRTVFDGDIKELNCKTAAGEITVLDHHRPLLTILTPGAAKIVDTAGAEKFVEIKGGLLEVTDGLHARCIIEE